MAEWGLGKAAGLPVGDSITIGAFGASLREYAVYTVDNDGYVTSWNPGAERISGAPAADVIGEHISMFYAKEQADAGRPGWVLRQAAEHGTFIDESWYVRRDGTPFRAHVVTTALRAGDGSLRGFAKLARDDTEVSNRLERSTRPFTDLFSLTPVGIGLFDPTGVIRDANPALCELLGYDHDDLIGMHATELVERKGWARRLFAAALESEQAPDYQKISDRMLLRSDEQVVPCDLHIRRSVQDTHEFWIVVCHDVTPRHRQAQELHYRSTHDELTGLPNRAGINANFQPGDPDRIAILYCDIDNFKRVNDSLGHSAGDELLIAVARHLQAELPPDWWVARQAGDEYLIICPDVDAAGGVEAVCNTVLNLLHTTVPVRGELIGISASIGVAVPGQMESSSEDLVRFASAAALDAKSQGPAKVSMANPALIASIDRQLHLEGELREAIDNNALTLHYQPIVREDGSILAGEALVRWPHPERGLITPNVFLPVAEQGGLLRDMDRSILRMALHEAASWPVPATGPVAVAINLAGLKPGDPHFAEAVTDIITSSGIAWRRVVLELVETSLIDLSPATRVMMRQLAGRGVSFSIDDFGTGYSSLTRLKDCPAQIIKADKAFVSGIGTNPADTAVLRAVTELARATGTSCTAEGVETQTQFNVLRGIGVHAYQGWLFSPALPPAEFRALIERGRISPDG